MAQKQHQQQCAQRQLSLWGELPDSILHRVLLVAAPRNHTSVNLVNKRWKAQHEVVVRNLSPPVWDAAWLGTRFPRLVSLMLDDQTTVRRPPVSQATALLPGPATPAAQHPHHYHQQQQREEEEGRVIVSDMDLIGLSTLSSLQALALKCGCTMPSLRPITRAGVSALVCGLTSLTALRLDRCRMTGGAMAALGELRTLKCLHLKDQPTPDEHMTHLGSLTSLTALYLEGCCLGDIGMQAMTSLRSLSTLCISSSRDESIGLEVQVTNTGLNALAMLPNLKALDLDCCSYVEGHALLALTGLTSLGLSRLRGLSREAAKALAAGLTSLAGFDLLDCSHLFAQQEIDLWHAPCPSLRSLRLCCMLCDEGLGDGILPVEPTFLRHCPGLTELNLGQSSFMHDRTIGTLASLYTDGQLPGLQKLWLSACDSPDDTYYGPTSSHLSDAGIAELAAIGSLRSLCLAWNSRITCRGLSYLVNPPAHMPLVRQSRLTQLEELDLTSCDNIADMGVSWLVLHMPTLQVLSLSDCNVTDLCLPHFSRLKRLRELSLKGCRDVSDAGLTSLAALTSLQELHLGLGPHEEELYEEHSGITDAGLGHLAAIKSLRVLSLEGREGVTDAGVAPLILALPNLTALDARRTQVAHGLSRRMNLPGSVLVKTEKRDTRQECLSDIFDLIARPMYKHCINPPHDWTGACHEQPCPCNAIWSKASNCHHQQGTPK